MKTNLALCNTVLTQQMCLTNAWIAHFLLLRSTLVQVLCDGVSNRRRDGISPATIHLHTRHAALLLRCWES